jgi:hypothetical protein
MISGGPIPGSGRLPVANSATWAALVTPSRPGLAEVVVLVAADARIDSDVLPRISAAVQSELPRLLEQAGLGTGAKPPTPAFSGGGPFGGPAGSSSGPFAPMPSAGPFGGGWSGPAGTRGP